MKKYNLLLILFSGLLCWEYGAINHWIAIPSMIELLQKNGIIDAFELTTRPGRTISYFLGIAGFVIILLTNIYIFQKKKPFLRKLIGPKEQLNFHIFCGLLGPLFILFHTDFKFRGLVGISFWSMLILVISGILGRYLYAQVLIQKTQLQQKQQQIESDLEKIYAHNQWPDASCKKLILENKGSIIAAADSGAVKIAEVILRSMVQDAKMIFGFGPWPILLNKEIRNLLSKHLIITRRICDHELLSSGHRLWHTFHLPFATLMYSFAIIHIGVVLLFGV